jgi:hypothetical protein
MERKAPQPLLQSQQQQQQQALPLMKNGIPRRLVPPPQPRPGPATGPGPTATGLPTPGPPGVTTATANATPLSPGQVVALVRDARKKALGDDDTRAPADAPAGADGLKPGITIDLIGKNIPALPDEVVDILRNGVERWVLLVSPEIPKILISAQTGPLSQLSCLVANTLLIMHLSPVLCSKKQHI